LIPPLAVLLGLGFGWVVLAPPPPEPPEPFIAAPCEVQPLRDEMRALNVEISLLKAESTAGGW
jgi:hypothetical protein